MKRRIEATAILIPIIGIDIWASHHRIVLNLLCLPHSAHTSASSTLIATERRFYRKILQEDSTGRFSNNILQEDSLLTLIQLQTNITSNHVTSHKITSIMIPLYNIQSFRTYIFILEFLIFNFQLSILILNFLIYFCNKNLVWFPFILHNLVWCHIICYHFIWFHLIWFNIMLCTLSDL